jgi:predicted anti-sigma-YlaC factor YlaD
VELLRDAAGGSEDSCERLRERHGDYLDGLLAGAELAQMQSHLAECLACARYDRVLRRGLGVARELPPLMPTDDFEHRLQHHIYHLHAGASFGEPRSRASASRRRSLPSSP